MVIPERQIDLKLTAKIVFNGCKQFEEHGEELKISHDIIAENEDSNPKIG